MNTGSRDIAKLVRQSQTVFSHSTHIGEFKNDLPGWQEGVMESALHVIESIGGRRKLMIPEDLRSPNTRRLIHGRS